MTSLRQTRWFSVVLMIAFLATSTLTRAAAVVKAIDFHCGQSLQTKSDNPGSSDQQFPFEEKEKEFEDKSESDKDDKDNTFSSNFFLICELSSEGTFGARDFNKSFASGCTKAILSLPLFLRNATLLI